MPGRTHARISLIITTLCLVAGIVYAFQPAPRRLPTSLQAELQQWRSKNNLAAWLKTCDSFIAADPLQAWFIYDYMDTALWRKPAADTTESTAWFRHLLCHAYDALKIQGDVPESKDKYEEALRFYGSARSYIRKDSNYLAAYLLKPLGNVYTRMGDYKSALLLHRQYIRIWQQTGDREELAAAYGNMAVAYRWQDSLAQASSMVQEGLKRVNPGSRQYAYLQSIAAEIQLCDSQYTLAGSTNSIVLPLYRALLLRTTGAEQALVAEGLAAATATEAELLQKSGNPEAAKTASRQALNLLQHYFPTGHNREKAINYRRLGDLFREQKEYSQAMSCYDVAFRQLLPAYKGQSLYPGVRQLFADYTLIDALSGKAACLLALQRTDEALEGLMLAAGLEQQLRLHFLSEHSKLDQLIRARTRSEQILELAAGLYRKSGNKRYLAFMLQQIERSKAQVLLEQWLRNNHSAGTKGALADAITERIAYYREWLATHDTGTAGYGRIAAQLKEQEFAYALQDEQGFRNKERLALLQDSSGIRYLLNAIPPDMLVLEYFAGTRNLYILSLAKGGILDLKISDSAGVWRQRTEQYLDTWYYQGPEKIPESPMAFCDASAALYRCLVPDISWQRYNRCMIIPDDYLCRLPFEALQSTTNNRSPNPGDWPYFLKKISLQQQFSLQLWKEQGGKHEKPGTKPRKTGVSGYFVSRFSKEYPELPGVRQEYQEEREQGYKAYLDQAATKARLRHSLAQQELIHISTHGIVLGPDETPALLMGDSILYAWELSRRQAMAPLVVLNTCRGANGILQQGEGVVSMARYLTAAGFKGVIASLWNVNDQSGATLLRYFYHCLQQDPVPASALTQAKLLYLENPELTAAEKTPYYWAGFVYTGADQQLYLKQYNTWWKTALSGIAATGIILFCICRYRHQKKRLPEPAQ